MKKVSILIGFFSFALLLVLLTDSCKKEGGVCGATNISATNGTASHNNGQNCMNCHKDGGSGEGGCFLIAGSVYDSTETVANPNGTVKLFSGLNGTGTLKATLHVDGKGNFLPESKRGLPTPSVAFYKIFGLSNSPLSSGKLNLG